MKVLIIGLGSIAHKHISALRAIDPAVRILAHRSSASGEKIPDVQDVYTWDEIDPDIDFVLISNPTHLHSLTLEKSLLLAKPIFLEKPAFSNQKDIAKFRGLASTGTIPMNYVGFNLRFLDCLQFLKNYLAQNDHRINEVTAYVGSNLADWRPNSDFRDSYSSCPERGGGVHLDLIHELDYLHWIFGTPTSVRSFHSSKSSLAIESVDFAHLVMEYQYFTSVLTQNYFRTDNKRDLEVVLENETLHVNLLTNEVTSSGRGKLFDSEQTIGDTYQAQMDYFLRCVQSGESPKQTIAESLKVLEIALNV